MQRYFAKVDYAIVRDEARKCVDCRRLRRRYICMAEILFGQQQSAYEQIRNVLIIYLT